MSLRCVALVALLLAPFAAAEVPAIVRCNQAYCMSLLDADGDGIPDGVLGGTSEVAHGAPTVQWGRVGNETFAGTSVLAGDEDEGGVETLAYAYSEDARTVYVALEVQDFDGETGRATPIAAIIVWLEDSDGDGRADRVRSPALP